MKTYTNSQVFDLKISKPIAMAESSKKWMKRMVFFGCMWLCWFVWFFYVPHDDVARFTTIRIMNNEYRSRDMIDVFYYCDAQLPMFFFSCTHIF